MAAILQLKEANLTFIMESPFQAKLAGKVALFLYILVIASDCIFFLLLIVRLVVTRS